MAKRFGITRGVPPAAFGFARVSVRGRSTLGGIEAGPNNLPHQTGHANEVSSSFSVPLRVSRLLNWVVWTLRFPMNNMHLGLFGVLGMLCGMLLYLLPLRLFYRHTTWLTEEEFLVAFLQKRW